jgi:hypothetical protein
VARVEKYSSIVLSKPERFRGFEIGLAWGKPDIF